MQGANQNTIQELNRSLVLNTLRSQGICSRAHIAQTIGLQQATVTYIVNDLIQMNFITEVGLISGKKGRRSIGIAINNDVYKIIGIRLSREYFTLGMFNLSGDIIESERCDIPQTNPKKVLKLIKEMVSNLVHSFGKQNFLAIGIAIPGPFIKKSNHIALMTGFPGWEEIDIKSELEDEYSIPVFMEHDANAGAFAHERNLKNGEDQDVYIYISSGAGIGAGVICNHEIFRGVLGIAGEIGHMSICFDGLQCECGNYGCLEKYSSSTAFTAALSKRIGFPISFSKAKSAVRNGDVDAIEEFEKCCHMLAVGIVNIVYIYNPSIIIIGDDMAHVNKGIMLRIINDDLKERLIPALFEPLTVQISDMKSDPALVGSGMIAVNEVLKKPSEFIKL